MRHCQPDAMPAFRANPGRAVTGVQAGIYVVSGRTSSTRSTFALNHFVIAIAANAIRRSHAMIETLEIYETGNLSLSDPNPTAKLHLSPGGYVGVSLPRYHQWQPQADITAYELALCTPIIAGNWVYGVQGLPVEARRHFRETP